MAAVNTGKIVKKIIKEGGEALGKASQSEVKALVKNNSKILYNTFDDIAEGAARSSVIKTTIGEVSEEATKTLANRKAITEVFEGAAQIGPKGKELYVENLGKTHKKYNKMVSQLGVTNEVAVDNLKIKTPKSVPKADSSVRNKIIEESRERSKFLNEKHSDIIEQSAIRKEIERNYKDPNLAGQMYDGRPKTYAAGMEPLDVGDGWTDPKARKLKEKQIGKQEKLNGKKPTNEDLYSLKSTKKARYDSETNYIRHNANVEIREADFHSDDFANSDLAKKINKKIGVTPDDIAAMDDKQLKKMTESYIYAHNTSDMGFADTMGYHKVPQKVTGVMGTAWLVNKMASGGGQQSNAQLYGQQGY